MDSSPDEITQLLALLTAGEPSAEARLIPIIYSELRKLAAGFMRRERPDHTLQPTALVHEAFLRLTGNREMHWGNRAHFFAVAAQVMRRILVDYARASQAGKRPDPRRRISLDSALTVVQEQSDDLLMIDEALKRLAEWDPRQCRILELRFFAGLSVEETAQVLGISVRTVKRDVAMAKAWLYGQLVTTAPDDSPALGSP